jgi:hypothetical protein
LDLLEDLAYRRLLDLYYLHERPLNVSVAAVARQIGMREHEDKVKSMLEEFFSTPRRRAGSTLAQTAKLSISTAKSSRLPRPVKLPLNAGSTPVQRTFNQTITKNQ